MAGEPNPETWMDRMVRALAERGCKSQEEWFRKFPGYHCWFQFDLARPWESCVLCGKVRRADDRNPPCKGVVTIGLRG